MVDKDSENMKKATKMTWDCLEVIWMPRGKSVDCERYKKAVLDSELVSKCYAEAGTEIIK